MTPDDRFGAGVSLPRLVEINVRSHRINAAIVQCLEHMATSTSPPGTGAADFLIRLLDDRVFAVDEVDEITLRVSIILRGITERHSLAHSLVPTTVDARD